MKQPRQQRILVTGAAGEIGSKLVRELTARGNLVRALLLPDDPCAQRLDGIEMVERVTGDITRAESLDSVFDEVEIVYHLAAVLLVEESGLFNRVNVEGTRNVARGAAAAGVTQLIHVSSASVVYPRTTCYSRSKRAGEQEVWEAAEGSAMHVTVVRPTLVYDGEGGLEFALFVAHLKRFPVALMVGGGEALKNPVHVDDLLGGLAALAGNQATHGKTYNLSGGEVLSLRDLARLLLAHSGLPHRPLLALPVPLCRLAAALAGQVMKRPLLMQHTVAGLTQDADLDPTAAARDLGYAPRGVRAGLGGAQFASASSRARR
jgi:nucleoside-diphosphate-sugar epimerase